MLWGGCCAALVIPILTLLVGVLILAGQVASLTVCNIRRGDPQITPRAPEPKVPAPPEPMLSVHLPACREPPDVLTATLGALVA